MSERLDIEAIKARCEAATPGPWEYSVTSGMSGERCVVLEQKEPHMNVGNFVTAPGKYPNYGGQHRLDFEFIAHSRTDIPALLDYISRLEDRCVTEARRNLANGQARMEAEHRVRQLEAGLAPFARTRLNIVCRDDSTHASLWVTCGDIRRAAALLASPPAQGQDADLPALMLSKASEIRARLRLRHCPNCDGEVIVRDDELQADRCVDCGESWTLEEQAAIQDMFGEPPAQEAQGQGEVSE